MCNPARVFGAFRRGRRRGGLQLYQLRAAWGAIEQLSGLSGFGNLAPGLPGCGLALPEVPRKTPICLYGDP